MNAKEKHEKERVALKEEIGRLDGEHERRTRPLRERLYLLSRRISALAHKERANASRVPPAK